MIRKIAIVAVALLGATGVAIAMSEDAQAKKRPGSCAMMTGKGVGLGNDLAKNFAADALADGQAMRGLKGSGKVAYKCSNDVTGLTNCAASQRSCGAPKKK